MTPCIRLNSAGVHRRRWNSERRKIVLLLKKKLTQPLLAIRQQCFLLLLRRNSLCQTLPCLDSYLTGNLDPFAFSLQNDLQTWMRSYTGRTCACARAFVRASRMREKMSSSSPNVTKTASSFSTLLRAAAAATSGGTDSLRGTAGFSNGLFALFLFLEAADGMRFPFCGCHLADGGRGPRIICVHPSGTLDLGPSLSNHQSAQKTQSRPHGAK